MSPAANQKNVGSELPWTTEKSDKKQRAETKTSSDKVEKEQTLEQVIDQIYSKPILEGLNEGLLGFIYY